MKKLLIIILLTTAIITRLNAQFWPGDKWYNNPLGFEPLKLHTSMGFLVPAAVVGATLLFTKKDTALTRRLDIYNESGFLWGYKYPYTFMGQNSTGISYRLRTWLSVGAELALCMPSDSYNKTFGVGIRPFARFYPVNNGKFRLYFESGAGLVYFFDNFPRPNTQDTRLGTHLNGLPKYGIGSEFNFTRNTSFTFGVKHLHVSNGNTKGADRNPSHDSNGFYIGFSYTPSK